MLENDDDVFPGRSGNDEAIFLRKHRRRPFQVTAFNWLQMRVRFLSSSNGVPLLSTLKA